MNNAAVGGGGGGGDFDWGRLYQATGKIEDLLGVIKGDELCKEYVMLVADHTAEGMMQQDYQYQTKPFDGRYQATFNVQMPVVELYTPEAAATAKQYDAAFDQSFANGVAWANGISSYLISLVTPLTEPSVSGMANVASSLRAIPLWSLLPSDFSVDGQGIGLAGSLDHWWGGSAASFKTFYNNIDDVLVRYAYLKDAAASWVDGCGALIAAVRTGLLEFLEGVGDHLAAIADQWTSGGQQGIGGHTSKDPVIEVVKVAYKIAEALPVVDKIVKLPKAIDDITDAMGTLSDAKDLIEQYSGMSLDQMGPETLEYDQSTAESIYQLITSTLVDKHITPLEEGMNAIATARSTDVMAEVGSLQGKNEYGGDVPGFFPNKVPQSIKHDPASFEGGQY